jgi:hypothetical protein
MCRRAPRVGRPRDRLSNNACAGTSDHPAIYQCVSHPVSLLWVRGMREALAVERQLGTVWPWMKPLLLGPGGTRSHSGASDSDVLRRNPIISTTNGWPSRSDSCAAFTGMSAACAPATARFRTIQVFPKDVGSAPCHIPACPIGGVKGCLQARGAGPCLIMRSLLIILKSRRLSQYAHFCSSRH